MTAERFSPAARWRGVVATCIGFAAMVMMTASPAAALTLELTNTSNTPIGTLITDEFLVPTEDSVEIFVIAENTPWNDNNWVGWTTTGVRSINTIVQASDDPGESGKAVTSNPFGLYLLNDVNNGQGNVDSAYSSGDAWLFSEHLLSLPDPPNAAYDWFIMYDVSGLGFQNYRWHDGDGHVNSFSGNYDVLIFVDDDHTAPNFDYDDLIAGIKGAGPTCPGNSPQCQVPNDTTIELCEIEQVCLPVGCYDPDGNLTLGPVIHSGPGTIIGGDWCYTPSGDEYVTVKIKCKDACNNTCISTFHVTFNIDDEPPVAQCPGNITVSNDPGQCDAVVTWSATVTDNCPGATISCTPPSGSTFPIGITPVTCIAIDDSGNADTCNFTVTVEDDEAPVASCPGDITVDNDPGQCDAVVTWSASVSDNCPGASISCTPTSGSTFPIGTTAVTCIAIDAVGNADTCSFNVTVEDNEDPVASCPGDLTVSNDPGQCDAAVTWSASVTDNCSGASISCAPPSGSTFSIGTTLVTCIAIDAVGNADTCSFDVTVEDNEGPVASCPGDLTVSNDPGQCDAVVTWSATVSDNCPGASISCAPPSGSTFSIGTTSVTCIAIDAVGNADTCSFDVTVEDNEDPVASCPGDITVSNDPGQCDAVVTWSASTTDNCPGASISCTPPSGSTFSVGTTLVTCIANDAVGNADTCSFNVTVQDDEDPVASCPGDITVNNDPGQCDAVVSWSASVTDNCPGASISCTPPSGSTFPVGTTQVTCTATDAAGNQSQCTFNVTVNDTEDPVAQCPGDITVSNDPGQCDAVVTWSATVTDNCSGATITCSPPSGSTFPIGTTLVTCTATDGAGNQSQCTFNVTVDDDEDPVAQCPGDITVDTDPGQCDAVVTWSANVTDNCPGATISCTPPSGSTFSIGTTQVTCTAIDAAGNQSQCTFDITVEDNEPPVASCPGDITVGTDPGSCDAVVTWSASFTDNCVGGSISCTPPSGTMFSAGTTPVTCIAIDAVGNADTCSFNVTVEENEPPVAQCPGDITVSNDPGECDAVVTWSATVTDNCPGATISCTPPSGSTFPIGTTAVTCIAIDAVGNADTCGFNVTVEDNEDPVASCPGDLTVDNDAGECDAVVTWSASVTDNCPGATISCTPASGTTFPIGTTSVTCIAIDAVGNADTCSFDVTVEDNEDPVAQCPGDMTVDNDPGQCDAVVSWSASVTDNCPGATISCTPPSGSTFSLGTTAVTCIAIDAVGNADTCSFNVTVEDNEDPVAQCPGDITVDSDPGECDAVVNWSASATDNCPGATISCSPPSGTAFSVGTTQVTCTATDAAGNQSQCTFDVTVEDNEDPVASCPGDITVDNDPGQCDAVVSWSPTVTDNCPGATISCSPSSGSTFSIGTTLVTCTATDASGNQSQCTFNVTVEDNEAPVAQCPGNLTVDNDPGQCDAVVTWSSTVSDNCPGATIVCDPTSGSTFGIGTAQVRCIATDAVGNADTCFFDISVEDTQAPVASCPGDITTDVDPGGCDATVSWSSSVSDNCAGATISCNPPSGSVFNVGTTPVTCIAIDAVGNADTCSFDVTVNQVAGPTCNLPADQTIVLDNPGQVCLPVSATDGNGQPITCAVVSGVGSIGGGQWCFNAPSDGVYSATIRCTDACGQYCEGTVTITIEINDPPELVVPPNYINNFVCSDTTVSITISVVDPNGNLMSVTVDPPSWNVVGNQLQGQVSPGDTLTVCVTAVDSNSASATECVFIDVDCIDTCVISARIETDSSLNGRNVELDVYLDYTVPEIGGFELRLCYDVSALALVNVVRGLATDEWEYFTYRTDMCSGGCPDGNVQLIGIADLHNGSAHPPESAFRPEGVIASLILYVTQDRDFIGQCVPITWCWFECTDNIIASRSGDTSFVNVAGIDPECLSNPKGEPVPGICFEDGRICIIPPPDDRGDLNMNGIPNEVGDYVLYSNYFIYGDGVWDPLYEENQILASDVNDDGIVLTVGDLVYLMRIITGDADPFPESGEGGRIVPSAGNLTVSTTQTDEAMQVTLTTPVDVGAAHFAFDLPSDAGVGTPVVTGDLGGLKLRSHRNGESFRILISGLQKGSRIAGGSSITITIPATNGSLELTKSEFADYYGHPIDVEHLQLTRVVPTAFALLQNYPNPFNAGTVIQFQLAEPSEWTLQIYNALGQRVRQFGNWSDAGTIAVDWDATHEDGTPVASGIYFYRLTAGSHVATRKMLLLR